MLSKHHVLTCGLWAIALHGITSPVFFFFFSTFTYIYNTFMDVLAEFVVLHYEHYCVTKSEYVKSSKSKLILTIHTVAEFKISNRGIQKIFVWNSKIAGRGIQKISIMKKKFPHEKKNCIQIT